MIANFIRLRIKINPGLGQSIVRFENNLKGVLKLKMANFDMFLMSVFNLRHIILASVFISKLFSGIMFLIFCKRQMIVQKMLPLRQ